MDTDWIEGKDFLKIGPPRQENGRFIYAARCCHCNAEFSNHRSIYKHRLTCKGEGLNPRKQLNLDTFLSKPQEEVEAQYKALLNTIASLDLPLNCTEDASFRELLKHIDPELADISKYELRKKLISYSDEVKRDGLLSFKDKMASLIVDGTTSWGNKLYEVVLYHPGMLFHLQLVRFDTATGECVATTLRDLINELQNASITVVGVTTDNGSNLVAAFRESHDYAVQHGISLPTIRFSCSAHSCQLIFDDLRKDCPLFEAVENNISDVVEWCRRSDIKKKLREFGFEKKLPKLSVTRWNATVEAIIFFIDNSEFFCHATQELHDSRTPEVYDDDWQIVLEATLPLLEFTNSVQDNHVSIAQVFHHFVILKDKINQLNDENPLKEALSKSILKRFSETCDMTLCQVAWSLTKEGHDSWFNRGQNLVPIGQFQPSQEEIEQLQFFSMERNLLVNKLTAYAGKFGVSTENVRKAYLSYLNMKIDIPEEEPYAFWCDCRGMVHNEVRFFDLATVAASLHCIPATEAVAERVFSLMKQIHSAQRSSLKPDIIDALLRIKTTNIWMAEDQ